ncbi:MAG: SOS response-associated peptidase [Mangrovibacterium sp.]
MCYDLRTKYKTQLERYKYWNEKFKEYEKIIDDRGPNLFHASGFQHPQIFIYTNQEPYFPVQSTWGLLPSWAKETKIWNQTLNARGETIFEKPSFRESAKSKRCSIYIDGFFEHHHFKGKTYPYYIFNKDESPMIFAGLWNDWADKATGEIINTFSIVTTTGNPMMAKIHNNPKLEGPRMPLILEEDYTNNWLKTINSDSDKQMIQDLITPYNQDKMTSYTVGSLRGKNAVGNVPESTSKVIYPELQSNQSTLF